MPKEPCIICGDPAYLCVDQRPFCAAHAWAVVEEIERTIDYLHRQHRSTVVSRFITYGVLTRSTEDRKLWRLK